MPEVPYPTAERFLVLINPYASGGQSPVVMRRRIASAFAEHDVPFDLVTPADPAEALEIAKAAAREGVRAVVAAGGDGTVAQALRGTAGTEVPVAIVPLEVPMPPIDRSALDTQKSVAHGPRAGSISTWAMLIKRVYEVDPLACPCCGGQMKIVSFIERYQADVIERILRHCGLWEGPLRTNAGPRAPPDPSHRGPSEPRNPQFVPDPELLESEYREAQSEVSCELQLVLDPEFL